MTQQSIDPEELLKGTPYLPGDGHEAAAFNAVLKQSQRVARRAQLYRETLAQQSDQARTLIRGAERGKQVAESNKIEGYMWEPEEVQQTVQRSTLLLDAPLRDLLRSVEADPKAYQVLGLYKAYEIADTWAHENRRPSEFDIRQLHQLITSGEPGAGNYRDRPVGIKNQEHEPPDPLEVPRMTHEMIEWWRTSSIDPLLTATIVHAWLTHIHPFHDGNGRLARLLASIALVQAGYPPLIIVSESERGRYYDHLAESDNGNILPLFDLFASMQVREAAMISKKDYVNSILSKTIYRDPGNRRKAWLSFYDQFATELAREFANVGWTVTRFGRPTSEQFALLEDRDSAGNSWAARITDSLGNAWLMWFGYRSRVAEDELRSALTPSLFFSPSDKFQETGKPFRRRADFEGADDGVTDEVILVAAPSPRCYMRLGRTVLETTVGDATQAIRKGVVSNQRRFL